MGRRIGRGTERKERKIDQRRGREEKRRRRGKRNDWVREGDKEGE